MSRETGKNMWDLSKREHNGFLQIPDHTLRPNGLNQGVLNTRMSNNAVGLALLKIKEFQVFHTLWSVKGVLNLSP